MSHSSRTYTLAEWQSGECTATDEILLRFRRSNSSKSIISSWGSAIYEQMDFFDIDQEGKRVASKWALDRAVELGRMQTPAPSEIKARYGYQEMARLPCYRAVRVR